MKELTTEEKNLIIDARLKDYSVKIFNLQMDAAALRAAGDEEGAVMVETSIHNVYAAAKVISDMRIDQNANS